MNTRRCLLLPALALAACLLAGCFSVDTPSFYTCSMSQPRCPDAMVCMPVSGYDSGILTDWRYERDPAFCLPIPKQDKGAGKKDQGKADGGG